MKHHSHALKLSKTAVLVSFNYVEFSKEKKTVRVAALLANYKFSVISKMGRHKV